ncbi:MAG: PKD domain-containing protein, partial [Bacteroidia bacterium]|nr:PKD domain-containing protein [Bacteroidia bacterium]
NITPKALTLTANNIEKCFNTVYNFDGTEFTLTGLVAGDEVNTASISSSASLIGATPSLTPYSIVPSNAGGADVLNYDITYVNGEFLVHGLPVPSFTFNDASQCLASNSFEITNTSTPGLGASSATYIWVAPLAVGLNPIGTDQILTYTSIGNYSVNVQVTSNKGCISITSFTNNVTVVEHPTALFTTTENSGNTANDYNICTGATVNFNASASTAGFGATSISTFQWRRDGAAIGGSPNSATYSPVVNAVTNPDLFDYTLRVQNNQGCWSHDEPTWIADPSREIFVYPFPVPSFTTPVVGAQGPYGVTANNGNGGQLLCHGKVVFANTSTIPSGSIVRYVWMYGDGSANDTVFTADNVKHEFPVNYTMNWFDPGFPNTRRSITLVAKSDEGCVTSVTNTKDIKNGPDAIIRMDDALVQPLVGNSFLFHNASMNRHPSFIDSSLWNWGDGTITTNTTFIPKVYSADGNYRVHLINYTGTGCTDTAYLDLTVGNPLASTFSYTPNTCGSKDVTFTNTSLASTSYLWDFGDGNSSTLENPTHTYTADGSYTVTLQINGTTLSTPQVVNVVSAPTVGAISTTGPSACGNEYTFTNSSSGINLTYNWTFSGGTGSGTTGTSVNRSYASATAQTVDLTVTADGRCSTNAAQYSFTSVAATNSPVAGVSVGAASVPSSTSKSISNTSTNASLYYVSLDGAPFTAQVTFPYDITGLSDGSHTIRLVASDLTGTCKDTASESFIITSVPCAAVANFDILPSSTQLLAGNNYTFFNITQVNGFGWISGNHWDFGDGTTSTNTHIYGKTFSAPGTYIITYTATLSTGACSNSISKSVTITAPTSASFTHTPNNCNDLDVAFTSTSTGATAYSWDFGDGNTSTLPNPTHTYAATGSYSVVLTINGSIASAPQTVHVASNPTVGPIINSGPSSCGNEYTFSNASTGVNLTYAWTFSGGTGSVSTSSSASRLYAGAASETVDLVVTSDGRCSANATQISFTSVAGTTAPNAAVTIGAASLPSSTSVSVNNASTNASLYYVSLDGAAFTAETTFPYDITGLSNGSHNVRLVASDLTGTCKDTATATFTISSTPCIAVASFNITPAASQPLSTNRFDFFNTTQHNGFGWVVTNAWDFGDGTTNNTNTHIYGKTYASAGTYTVTLVATSSTGCSSTITQNVTVTANATASFTHTQNACINRTVAFANTSVSASSYLWNFGDGNTSTQENPAHTYAADGVYNVTLTINGSIVSAPQTVTVATTPVAGSISNSLSSCGNVYTYSVTGATGLNLTYTWSFANPDGAGSTTGSSVTRTYTAGGPESVSLLVTADGRCTATPADLNLTTLTAGTIVSASLQIDASDACSGTRTIDNVGSTGATSYEVSVDGAAYEVKSSFPYDITGLTPGTHTVSLKAVNGLCSDIVTETFVVGSISASFTSSSSTCGPTVTFTNTTTATSGTPTYNWDFNSEGTSTSVSPSYTFASAGTKSVTLVATLPNGCSSTVANSSITANPGTGNPVASFTSEMIVNGSCNTGIRFTSTSTGATTYVWNYGDGTVSVPSTTSTIFHAYSSTGTFAVTLTASGACGQTSTHTANVVVTATGYPTPEVSFSTDNATQCVSGNRFDFFNRTQLNGWGWVNTYRWYFGDGTTDFVNTFSYGKTYASPGTYTVKLVGISNFGCADSSTMEVVVLAPGACTPGKMRGDDKGKISENDGGTFKSYSDLSTTGLSNSQDKSNELVLYPNPNKGDFKIAFKELNTDNFVISIVDMLGREVFTNTYQLKGAKELDLVDLNLAPGSYNLVLNGTNDVFARKSFVVIK